LGGGDEHDRHRMLLVAERDGDLRGVIV